MYQQLCNYSLFSDLAESVNCGSIMITCISLYSVVGVSGLLILGIFCSITLVSVKFFWKAHRGTQLSTHRENTIIEPVYDTINPTYEMQMSSKEIDMTGMKDNAAYLVVKSITN